MNSLKKVLPVFVGAVALLLGSSGLHAQISPTSEAGLIGRRHAGFDFTYERYNGHTIDYTFGAGAEANLPVKKQIDLSFGYDLAHTNGTDHSLNHNALLATVLNHQHTDYGEAYFAGTVGQGWNRWKDFGVLRRDDDAFWGLATGYEIPMGTMTAINAGLAYRNAFRGNQTTLQYRIEASHWVSSDFAAVVSASYNQISKAPDTLLYTVGVRWALR